MGVTLISPTASHGGLNWDTNLEMNLGRLADGINLAAGLGSADLNTVLTSGIYYGAIASLTNGPVSGGSSTLVLQVASSNVTSGSGHIVQRATRTVDGATWQRSYAPGFSWTAWTQVSGDTGWSLSPIALATGWTTCTDPAGSTTGTLVGGVRRVGQQVEYQFRVNRGATAGDVTSTASGNIAGDPVIANVSPSTYPQFVPTGIREGRFGVVGVQAGTARIDQTGAITILDMYPSDTLAQGATIQVGLTFLAG